MKQTSLILTVIGAMLFIFGLNVRQRWTASRMQQAPGKIIDKQEDRTFSDEALTAVVLMIQYETMLGQTCDFQVRQLQDSGANVGDRVNVFYDPAHPEQATIDVPQSRPGLFAISFILGGCVCLLFALLLFAASQAGM